MSIALILNFLSIKVLNISEYIIPAIIGAITNDAKGSVGLVILKKADTKTNKILKINNNAVNTPAIAQEVLKSIRNFFDADFTIQIVMYQLFKNIFIITYKKN